jgi:DsbE subfamily thiol:disulfide oxidoreductase
MKPRYFIWGLWMIVAVTLVFTGWKSLAAGKDVSPEIGKLAPDFTLSDIHGKSFKLKDVTKQNKVTLINFWATWCPPCRGEIPELIQWYKKYASQKMALLAIDLQEDPGKVKTFAKEKGMNFTVLVDTNGEVGNQYWVSSIPTTFIVDSKGRIREKIVGGTTLEALEAIIQPLLKGK